MTLDSTIDRAVKAAVRREVPQAVTEAIDSIRARLEATTQPYTQRLRTVEQYAAECPALSKDHVARLVSERESNGLLECGGVVEIQSPRSSSRQVRIDPMKFDEWFRSSRIGEKGGRLRRVR